VNPDVERIAIPSVKDALHSWRGRYKALEVNANNFFHFRWPCFDVSYINLDAGGISLSIRFCNQGRFS
jgi:hypothetical protein